MVRRVAYLVNPCWFCGINAYLSTIAIGMVIGVYLGLTTELDNGHNKADFHRFGNSNLELEDFEPVPIWRDKDRFN